MMSTLRRAKRGAANDSLNQGGPWWALVGLGPPPQPGEAYLSRRGRVLYHLRGNSGWSGNTLGTRLTGVSPRNAEQPVRRRRDVAGLHRLINATQGPSQALCSVRGANCRAVQPFFPTPPPCLCCLPDRNRGLLQNRAAAKSTSAPLIQQTCG